MQKYWTDLHSNIHHGQMGDLARWIAQAKDLLDFWPIAYYPFHMRKDTGGAVLEGLIDAADMEKDWEILRATVQKENDSGFPMFMGYEWQGAGLDGDHNVFFLRNSGKMIHPMRYSELRDGCPAGEAIGIPHHIAYQFGSRGKNWSTHDEAFSPFAEVFSSHGCSENDTGDLDMLAHLHMGPRTGETCYEHGLNLGLRVGCMASGDNHVAPAACDHGLMCVLAEDRSKESLWEGLLASRVYGVSRSRMEIDWDVDGVPMGGAVLPGAHQFNLSIRAADAIDRVEILKDNVLEQMLVHAGTWERTKPAERETFKIKLAMEFGWGPNPVHYPGLDVKHWTGSLITEGSIVSIEKQWNNFGQKIEQLAPGVCAFEMTTYMGTQGGGWMSSSKVEKEGFVFELEGRLSTHVRLIIDGKAYQFTFRELMQTSRILAQYEESEKLAKETYRYQGYYRDDFIWHNAYKCRLRQAVPEAAYTMNASAGCSMEIGSQLRLRVHLRNGDRAWVSPVFCRERT